jgi:hypothetical protein
MRSSIPEAARINSSWSSPAQVSSGLPRSEDVSVTVIAVPWGMVIFRPLDRAPRLSQHLSRLRH